ncbi:MAG: hypothetical protein AB9903_22510 [Vulcanimicrobiota bacterium]
MSFPILIITVAALCLFIFLPGGISGPAGASGDSGNDSLMRKYLEIESMSPPRFDSLTAEKRQFLFDAVANHEVAGIKMLKKYDPEGIMGFCYGRAMASHLIACRMGLTPGSIRKIFMVGVLNYCCGKEWRFHVSTIVKGDDRRWYAIDPTRGLRLNTVDGWVGTIGNSWEQEKKVKLYLTSTSAITPDISVYPDPEWETGDRIIELSFDPAKKAGFTLCDDMGLSFYRPDKGSQYRYFLCTGSSSDARFDFRKAVKNGRIYSFNGYFEDLLDSIRKAPDSLFEPGAALLTI